MELAPAMLRELAPLPVKAQQRELALESLWSQAEDLPAQKAGLALRHGMLGPMAQCPTPRLCALRQQMVLPLAAWAQRRSGCF